MKLEGTRDGGVPAAARRRLAKAAVTALAIAAFGVAGFSGVLAKDGADDWGDWDVASGGWGDRWVFGSGGSAGGSGGWDDDWDVASGGSGGWDDD